MNIGQLEHVVEVIRFSSFALAATPRFQFVEPTLNGFLSFLRNGGRGVYSKRRIDTQGRSRYL